MNDDETPDVSIMEAMEYLLSATAIKNALANHVDEEQDPNINSMSLSNAFLRGSFRMHRFQVFSWLMLNGVAIPARLLDDRVHPEPGDQMPDETHGW